MKKNIKLKIFDLRCDKYLKNTFLALILKDEDSGQEILLPISDYEFRCIKNLVFRKESLSYIDSLSKNFFFKKNELILQNEEIKSKLTFSTTDNFTQDVILPPIEALLYCADRKIDIFVEEETFKEIQKLDCKLRHNIHEYEEEIVDFSQNKIDEKNVILNNSATPNIETKENFIDFPKNTNILNFGDISTNKEEIFNVKITEENIKSFSSENLLEILKSCLAEYHYENAIIIQEELKSRNIDFRHELCEEDFL